jgi:hypothetical protein
VLRATFLFALVTFAVLVLTGAIEVKVNMNRLMALPREGARLVEDGSFLEQGRVYGTKIKRSLEQSFVKDDHRRAEMALLYVKSDIARVNELLEKYPDQPSKVLPQLGLLTESVKRLQNFKDEQPNSWLAADTQKVLAEAAAVQEKLRAKQKELSESQENFTKATESFEAELGSEGEESATKTPAAPTSMDLKF